VKLLLEFFAKPVNKLVKKKDKFFLSKKLYFCSNKKFGIFARQIKYYLWHKAIQRVADICSFIT